MDKVLIKAEELEKYTSIEGLKKIIPISQDDILSIEDLMEMIDELYREYSRLEEKLES